MQIITSCDIYYENKVQFHMRMKWGVGPFTYLLILIILFLYCHTFIRKETETVFKLINFSKLTQFQSGRARHTALSSRRFCPLLLDLLINHSEADSFTDGMTWRILPCSMKTSMTTLYSRPNCFLYSPRLSSTCSAMSITIEHYETFYLLYILTMILSKMLS